MKINIFAKRPVTGDDERQAIAARINARNPEANVDWTTINSVKTNKWDDASITLLCVEAADERSSVDQALADKALLAASEADERFDTMLYEFTGTKTSYQRVQNGKRLGSNGFCYAKEGSKITVDV